jgi:hypothetical protein
VNSSELHAFSGKTWLEFCSKLADMTYVMKLIDQPVQVASIELAGALLRAWVRGDRPALAVELDRSSRTPTDRQDTGEEERLQMLGAIAARMKAYPDPLAASGRDLEIGVCVKLLSHLADPTMQGQANPSYSRSVNDDDVAHHSRYAVRAPARCRDESRHGTHEGVRHITRTQVRNAG